MTDSKFFGSSKKGELYELKNDLNSVDKDKIKDAVKKTIASMTVGKDVSPLLADVLKNMQTEDLSLKKLIYLYLMNYAKTNPELAILAVNTFVKDCDDPNPLIRALAIRTMGCIRVDKIIDYLCLPLGKCIKDPDPYVRKTAVIGIAKLFDLNPGLCESNGFLEELANMLNDSNPMVVSNAVAAMAEINEETGQNIITMSVQLLNQLLAAMNECNEWGQIFILDSLAKYRPTSSREAQQISERVLTRLNHANAAVVLTAVKVLLKLVNFMDNKDQVATVYQKIAAPLVTQLSEEPEIAYVALRNIDLVLRKVPNIMSQDMRVFFCKYNDPPYVKLEKLEIIVRLASEKNLDAVLSELKEYATEADVDFVRRAVSAIGRIAIKLDRVTERCISALLDLIKTKVNYVVQEAIVVIKDIFRKYPNQYESLIPALAENIESLDESSAKASMVWIVGEYGERIDNAGELLETLMENFEEDAVEVQLQLLTATVKLFLKKPAAAQALVQKVLQMATSGSDNPDLRDRGFIYWRLLSTDPAAAKAVVLAEKPPISGNSDDNISGSLLDELLDNLTTIASVYHKPAATFINSSGKMAPLSVKQTSLGNDEEDNVNDESLMPDSQPDVMSPAAQSASGGMGDLLDLDLAMPSSAGAGPAAGAAKTSGGVDDLLDLLGGGPTPAAAPAAASPGGAAPSAQRVTLLTKEQGLGLEITAVFARRNASVYFDLQLRNYAPQPMSDFGVQFNKNSFALAPAAPMQLSAPLMPNQTVDYPLQLSTTGQRVKTDPLNLVQIAFKNNVQVFYTQVRLPLHVLFTEDGRVDQQGWMQFWQEHAAVEHKQALQNLNPRSLLTVQTRLPAANVFVIGSRQANGVDTLFTSVKVGGTFVVLLELNVVTAQNALYISGRSNVPELIPLVIEGVDALVRA